ncbi:hypothetical protein, partial [Rhodoferax sp.]|uniref:hypothetical protein n=1 Tax=Rhodoferax sp. TaxID=50421 RepID=UPI0026266860
MPHHARFRLAPALLALTTLLALPATTLAQTAKPVDKKAGIPVKVTPEMTGAGIVSSGVTLPPIPP